MFSIFKSYLYFVQNFFSKKQMVLRLVFIKIFVADSGKICAHEQNYQTKLKISTITDKKRLY
jgi:hypothetical protein